MSLSVLDRDWDTLFAEALTVENPKGPARILALIATRNALTSESDSEEQEDWESYQTDLGAIYRQRWSYKPLLEDERAVWVDRLAWLLKTLRACQDQPLDETNLLALLRVGSAFATEARVWQRLPPAYLSENLISGMAALIGSTQCSFSASVRSQLISEREPIDHFLDADANDDWPEIERAWQTIVPSIRPDADLMEAAACLCAMAEKGYHVLARTLDARSSILPIICVAIVMTPDQISQVAIHAQSDRTRFALVQSLAFAHPRNEPLPALTLENLAKLFALVQRDHAIWRKWMQALNRFPVRTKSLQRAFGLSLVGSDESAKSAYIDAIDLSIFSGECRNAVTDCLLEFQKAAAIGDRKVMWTLALQRWEAWDFDTRKRGSPLLKVAVSELDFALIGYGLECLSDDERQEKLRKLSAEMTNVRNIWHSDRTAFNVAWYRALSRWQVFTYAAAVRAGQQKWELPLLTFFPFDIRSDRYLAMTHVGT